MLRLVLPILAALSLSAAPASALLIAVSLDAAQENPAPDVTGFNPMGSATVDVDTTTGAISITGSYSGMTSNVIGSHLHGLTDPDPTAPVILALTPSGGTDGTFSGSGTLSSAELAGLLEGRTYINIHTLNNMPGEIRGDVVPEPGTGMLLGLGCLALALGSRRRG